MTSRRVSVAVVVMALSWCACGCRLTSGQSGASLCPDDLSKDAHAAYAAYVRAINAGIEKAKAEIPRTYWADRIAALNPVKVYTHRVNLVVVRECADGIEKGKYIYIPVSSYLPQSGDDGFEFTPNPVSGNAYNLDNGVFDFKRER